MNLEKLVNELAAALKAKQAMLATAESCTGGWVSEVITSLPGSSHWFDRGFVVYTNVAKREMLGVKTGTLARFGAVSEQTARAMAEGVLANSRAQYSLAITGIAGPGGGTPEKPVGTVWVAWAGLKNETRVNKYQFKGGRKAVRAQAVEVALRGIRDFIG